MIPVYLPVPAVLSWSYPTVHQVSMASAECKVHDLLPVQACPVAAMYCQPMGLYADRQQFCPVHVLCAGWGCKQELRDALFLGLISCSCYRLACSSSGLHRVHHL